MTSPFDSASGFPCSVVRISARSSTLASISSNHLRSTLLRSFAVFARQAGHAAFAASIARLVSDAPITGDVPTSLPVAGLTTGCVAPPSASCHLPSM